MPDTTPSTRPGRMLVVSYSMSGHTAALAERLARDLSAERDLIRETRPRQGLSGVLRALVDAAFKRPAIILAPAQDPADYQMLVLGGPVWAGRMATPVRAYATEHGPRARQVAFFCTMGGRGAETAFADLQSLCGKTPVATLAESMTASPALDDESRFARELRTALAAYQDR